MAALLDRWLGDSPRLRLIDEASVALVRERVRREADALGLAKVAAGAAVNIASELGHNQLAHARGGEMAVRRIERTGVAGLEVIAADCGPGITSPAEALEGAPTTGEGPRKKGSLGVGLQAVLELADETDFDVRIGEGTCVWARKFSERPLHRRRQVGVYGRPCANEDTSGDDGIFLRRDDALLVAIADGVGHGVPAREASETAIEVVESSVDFPPDQILMKCHQALGHTRGAVMSVVRVSEPGQATVIGCAGNTSVHLYAISAARRFSGPSFVLGAPGRPPRVSLESQTLAVGDVLVLFTDGLTTKTDLTGELDLLLRRHPIRIAEELVRRFGRSNDDALVLVAR